MFLVGIFQWWYGTGFYKHVRQVYVGLLKTADFFSIGLLLKTLFNPFRQISAGVVQGGLPEQFRAFLDRSFSRVFGAFLRTILIAVGLICLLVRMLWSVLIILAWLLLPLAPLIGIVFWQMGVAS